MKRLILAGLVAFACGAGPSFAQGWYLGAGIGRGNLNVSGTDLGLPNAQVGDSATTYNLRVGAMMTPYFGVELGYYDHGEYDFSGSIGAVNVAGTAKAKSFGLSAIGVLPVSAYFDVYGRLGYASSELKANASAAGFVANDKDNERGMLYGVGAHWNVSRNVGVFAEWGKADKIKVDSYLVGVDFRF